MPLYEYACNTCGNRFETRQGIKDAALTECPNCGGAIRRVIQAVGIVFKGSGFYKTDSRSSTEAAVPAAERKSDTATPATTGSDSPASPPKPAQESKQPAASDGAGTAATTTP